jgi:hypothetical protein
MNYLKVKQIKLGFIVCGLVILSACNGWWSTSTDIGKITAEQIVSAQADLDGVGNTDITSSESALTATQIEDAQAALDAIEPPTAI